MWIYIYIYTRIYVYIIKFYTLIEWENIFLHFITNWNLYYEERLIILNFDVDGKKLYLFYIENSFFK